jgi:hypothetical protein
MSLWSAPPPPPATVKIPITGHALRSLSGAVLGRLLGGLLVAVSACSESVLLPVASQGVTRADSLQQGMLRPSMRSDDAFDPPCDPSFSDCLTITAYMTDVYMGYIQPRPIQFYFFGGAVGSITLVGISGTVQCNGQYGVLTAYDADSAVIMSVPLTLREPINCNNPTYNFNFTSYTQVTLVSPVPIVRAILTPMDSLEFHMSGLPPGSDTRARAQQYYWMTLGRASMALSILEAKGPNDSSSFLAGIGKKRRFKEVFGQDSVTLRARVSDPKLEPSVTWAVVGLPVNGVASPVPSTIASGVNSGFKVPAPGKARWGAAHPYVLSRTALAYEVRASAGRFTSEKKIFRQDSLDVERQEYIDLDVPQHMVPARSEFGFSEYYNDPRYRPEDNALAVVNPQFDAMFLDLKNNWAPHEFHVNSLYRTPGHNAYHVDPGKSSGSVSASWHQYGCGADIQTFPVISAASKRADIVRAQDYWEALKTTAEHLGFYTEARDPAPPGQKWRPSSGVGHVHVEIKCRK